MSSLTSIGVNKNKKSFAPKKRKERKAPAVSQPVSSINDALETSEIKFAHTVNEAQEPLPTIHPTTTAPPIPFVPTQSRIPLPTVSPSYFPPANQTPISAPSPGAVLPKTEPLTEEELAINAFSRRKRSRATVTSTPIAPSVNASTSITPGASSQTAASVPITTPAPSVPNTTPVASQRPKPIPRVIPATPLSAYDAPSPMAPIERPDCTFESESLATRVKIERMTPEVRIKLAQAEPTFSRPTVQPPSTSAPTQPDAIPPNTTTGPETPLFDPKTPKQDLEEQDTQTAALLAAAADVNAMDDFDFGGHHDEDFDELQDDAESHVEDEPQAGLPELSTQQQQEDDESDTDFLPAETEEDGDDEGDDETRHEESSSSKAPKRKQTKKQPPRKRQKKDSASQVSEEEEEQVEETDIATGSRSSRQAKTKATQAISEAEKALSDFTDESSFEEEVAPVRKPATTTTKKKPTKPKDKGKGKATTKPKPKPAPKPISKTTPIAPVSISIGLPGQPQPQRRRELVPNEDGHLSETTDSENETYRMSRRKKRRAAVAIAKPDPYAYRQVKNMRTLDDVTEDPSIKVNTDKPMLSFTRDIDGVVSKTFKEMEVQREEKEKIETAKKNMSAEELDALREREQAEEAEKARKKEEEKERKEAERLRREAEGEVLTESSNALQVRIVNGEIVLDTDTLTVERSAPESMVNDGMLEVVEENSLTRKVNSRTYGRHQNSSRWDEMETEMFYDCLSQFGTDFEMIAMMMPNRTRTQIRLKFNREERLHPEKVTDYMIRKRKPMDIEKYKEMSGIDTLEAVPEDFHQMQLG